MQGNMQLFSIRLYLPFIIHEPCWLLQLEGKQLVLSVNDEIVLSVGYVIK